MPDPRRQLAGRRSKASGETFERWISNACEFYLQNGWAHIEKTPEPFHITGKDRDGTVKGYYEKKGQPDYKGILCDGTGIMFEAKHTDGDRIRQNVVTDTQWESLDIVMQWLYLQRMILKYAQDLYRESITNIRICLKNCHYIL